MSYLRWKRYRMGGVYRLFVPSKKWNRGEAERFFWRWMKISLLLVLVVGVVVQVLATRYVLGVDGQRVGCLPWRVYFTEKAKGAPYEPKRGDLVRFSGHGMDHPGFPDGIQITKFVAGVPGDTIEVKNDRLYINGTFSGRLWLLKTLGKEGGAFDRFEVVPSGRYFLLGTTPNSYDSRYWGFVESRQIMGRAHALL